MNSKSVLIIEDKLIFRNSIKRALKSDGYSFVEAETIKQALAVCRGTQAPKVILLDLELPDGTGREFLEQLGTDIQKFKIMVLTGHEEHLAADVAREFSVFRYLAKGPKISEALRFTTLEAFKNIELEQLVDKNKVINKIQGQIHLDIPESTSIQETKDALGRVLNLINASVKDLVEGYTSHIRLYHLEKGDYHLAAFAGPNDAFSAIFEVPKRRPEPFSGMIAGAKEPRNFADLQADQDFQKWKAESLSRLESDGAFDAAKEYFDTVQSAFIAPITTHLFADEIDAVFNVSADAKNFFSPDKQEIILEFVSQATAAITKAWQKVRKQETHHDYRRINGVLEDISRELGTEDAKLKIYNIVTKGIYEIIKPESISLYLYNKSTGLLDNAAEFRAGEHLEPSREGHPSDKGLTALVYVSGKPVRVPNLQKPEPDRRKPLDHDSASQELYNEYVKLLPSGRVDHYLGVPMIIGKEVIGAIQLLNKTSDYYGSDQVDRERWLLERGFSDDCENALGIAANHLAVSIRNADLLDQNVKQITQLGILKNVGRFTTREDLKDLLARIICEAAEVVQAEVCLLFTPDESGSRIVLAQRYGISESDLPDASYEIGDGFTGRVARNLKPLLIEKDVPEGKYDKEILRHLRKQYGQAKAIESLMIVPIKVVDELRGVIKVINKKANRPLPCVQQADDRIQRYDADDLKFFEEFASYVGIAIDNTQRYAIARTELATYERRSTLSHLVASVAHEINNTQGLIPEYLSELQEMVSFSASKDAEEIVRRINDVAMQTVYLSNEIGGYAAGKRGDEEILDINKIVEDAIHEIPSFKRPKNFDRIEVIRKLSPMTLISRIHRTPLIQTIRNLIINAYQAFDKLEGGHIVISTDQDDDAENAIIRIADDGPGIDEQFLQRIFDPDFTTKRGSGSGLGLWLAKRDLEDAGGGIKCESKKGEGAKFTLTIPLHHPNTTD